MIDMLPRVWVHIARLARSYGGQTLTASSSDSGMAPSAPAIALTLAFGIGGRSGDSFHVQSSCCTRWMSSNCAALGSSRTLTATANSAAFSRRRSSSVMERVAGTATATTTAVLASTQQGEERYGGGRENDSRESYENVLGETAADTAHTGAGKEATDAEAEALRRQVFANEKGFLESSAFNPARARAKEEEEQAKNFAAQWGITPERAKEVMRMSHEGKESFQALERIAKGMNLSDEQQNTFMLQASFRRLAAATTPPKKARPSRFNKAMDDRVLASEKGFMKNSKEFKSRMKVGSGVRFDAEGFPVVGDDDEVIQAAKKVSEARRQSAETPRGEGVTFPSLPDCPRCSAPTMEDELSQFGVCAQCKATELSTKAYRGPPVASKYTYDNGEAPFSDSWMRPTQYRPAKDKSAEDRPRERKGPTRSSPFPPSPAPSSFDRHRKPPPAAATSHPRKPSSSSRSQASFYDDPVEPTAKQVVVRKGNGNASTGGGGSGSGSSSGPGYAAPVPVAARAPVDAAARSTRATTAPAVASPAGDRTAGTVPPAMMAAQRRPAAGVVPSGAAAAAAATTAATVAVAVDARSALSANGVGHRGSILPGGRVATSGGSRGLTRVPAQSTNNTASKVDSVDPTAMLNTRGDNAPGGGGNSIGMRGTDSGEAAMRKLTLEVAEIRTLLGVNRAALARVAQIGAAAAGAGSAAAMEPRGEVAAGNSKDNADVRRLIRDVAELRKELTAVADKAFGANGTPPRGRGGDLEVVQTVRREVAELRNQLESERKVRAATQLALGRLRDDVEDLRKKNV